MAKKIELRYIEDPGHGWAEVPSTLAKAIGIGTDFTYRNDMLYLEEDWGGDARLIAAAPELLAALKDLVHYDEGSSEEDSYGYEVLQRCKSAIAKAEGEGRVMSKWLVNVVRVGYASRIIEVDAESEEKAKQLAMDTAGNYQFDEHTSDYEFDWIAPAKAEGRE